MAACSTLPIQPQDGPKVHPRPPVNTTIHAIEELWVFDMIEQPIWVFNVTRRSMSWANQAGVELWDAKSLEELQARSFQDMSDSTVTRLHDYETHFFSKGKKVKDQWTYYPNGVAKTVQVTMSGLKLQGSSDMLMLNVGVYVLADEDIQSRKDALRGVEMLRHLPVSIAQFNMKGDVMCQNPESLETFGCTEDDEDVNDQQDENKDNNPTSIQEEESQKSPEEPVHDFFRRFADRTVAEKVLQDVKSGKTVVLEASQVTKTHGPRWSLVKLKQSMDPVTSEPVILYSARDITDIAAAKKEKEVAAKKNLLWSILAHEIRTPLHQVTGFIDLLSQTKLDAEQLSFVKSLQTSAHGLMVVLSDVLDYSKLEAGKMKLEHIPFEPRMIMECSTDAMRPSFADKKLSLELNIDKSVPFKIVGDSCRLRQIMINLLSNAAKFCHEGGVRVEVTQVECNSTLLPSTNHGTQHVVLKYSVHDTGIGISEENRQQIFEEYQQATPSIARNYGGTGLGLSICKKLVENMGGTIGVDSELGKGSTFWFTLPSEVPPEGEAEEPSPVERPVASSTPAKGLNVLVAEDNRVNQKLIANMLKRTGNTCHIVDNGKLAVEAMQRDSGAYDLILMDLQMPVMDGIEATKRIRGLGFVEIPIFALTASIQRADFAELGLDDWIGKPFRLNIFTEKLKLVHPIMHHPTRSTSLAC